MNFEQHPKPAGRPPAAAPCVHQEAETEWGCCKPLSWFLCPVRGSPPVARLAFSGKLPKVAHK
eukprot:2180781-Pyramimonas_sp.AAC.1